MRFDRNDTLGQNNGGGICVFVNQKWCSQFTPRESVCNPDIELVCLSLFYPLHLPHELGDILLCSVYIPASGDTAEAATLIADCVHRQLLRTQESPWFIVSHFNHRKLEVVLLGFKPYVDCKTLGN